MASTATVPSVVFTVELCRGFDRPQPPALRVFDEVAALGLDALDAGQHLAFRRDQDASGVEQAREHDPFVGLGPGIAEGCDQDGAAQERILLIGRDDVADCAIFPGNIALRPRNAALMGDDDSEAHAGMILYGRTYREFAAALATPACRRIREYGCGTDFVSEGIWTIQET